MMNDLKISFETPKNSKYADCGTYQLTFSYCIDNMHLESFFQALVSPQMGGFIIRISYRDYFNFGLECIFSKWACKSY